MTDVQIILPAQDDTPLVDMLIEITKAIEGRDPELVSHGFLGGEHGYGARWENDTFLMQPYCWCDREGECPWCTGCNVYQDRGQCKVCADPKMSTKKRLASPLEFQCDYSAGRGIFARFAPWTLDHSTGYYDPPNFWHKPTNLRVTWYKYIGRDMHTRNLPADLSPIMADCVASLPRLSSVQV